MKVDHIQIFDFYKQYCDINKKKGFFYQNGLIKFSCTVSGGVLCGFAERCRPTSGFQYERSVGLFGEREAQLHSIHHEGEERVL